MLTRTNLLVDVGELLRDPGRVRELAFTEPVDDLSTELARVDGPVGFELTFEVVDEGVLVRGAIATTAVVTCRRCLEEVQVPLTARVAEAYRPRTDVWEEGYVVADDRVDLGPLVRDNILLKLPEHPLCRDDCKGLCVMCGANLNDGDCGCEPEGGDLRWAALRELLEKPESGGT